MFAINVPNLQTADEMTPLQNLLWWAYIICDNTDFDYLFIKQKFFDVPNTATTG